MFCGRGRQGYWVEVIEKALDKLELGDIRALLTVYCAFAVGDKKLMRRAGTVIRKKLEPQSLKQMIGLYERFRMFTSLEWSIDWSAVPLRPALQVLDEEEQKYVLILGSFHPNGYFRERCMEELAGVSGTLPYLMLRANDWAEPVRRNAFLLLGRYIDQCSVEEILAAMPVLEKIQCSGRRSDEQMKILKDQIYARLKEGFGHESWQAIWPEDVSVRRSLYRLTIKMRVLSIEQMDCWLRKEKDSCAITILIKGILAHPDCTLTRASGYLSYPNTQIRTCALEYQYEHLKDS